ncbi:putative carboxypeptidase B [Apostichopus japonicus]|uniref:Putative carboxypeptidase B n=1 Tax=Stichopus japonicus TaxID=307972 RepID=A0A2G8LIK0_STIJA|nr:putative carboxypeptidase B [Apostichopus japonicus]
MRNLILFLAFVLRPCLGSGKEIYRGNQLWFVFVNTDNDLKWLLSEEEQSMGELDFWSQLGIGRRIVVMVSHSYIHEFKVKLMERQIEYQTVHHDVQVEIDKFHQHDIVKRSLSDLAIGDFDYEIYHTYDEIQQWLRDMADEYTFVHKFTLGYTFENREIGGIEIAAPALNDGEFQATVPKPIVYFEGGIHAREWITPATIMYFTRELLDAYENGEDNARKILGIFDLHIVPSLNGDGYAFTWEHERLWRKSRQPNIGFGCVGTDLNRNFGSFWGRPGGASRWPCSGLFRGFAPFDNNETKAVDDYFKTLKAQRRKIKVFIDWHNWGQMILAPWSYAVTDKLPAESEDQLAAGEAMAEAMTATNFIPEGFKAGVSAQLLYEMTGSSNDYGFAGTPEAKYSYVVELRDSGHFEFLIPPDQIRLSGEEGYDGVVALLDWIINNDY